MTHAAARGRGRSCDERHHGLGLIVLLDPSRSLLFGGAADLADHDDALGLLILHELLEAVDEVCAVEGVASNADNNALAEADSGGLENCLVSQRAGARHDADLADTVDVAGHDANLEATM